MADELLDRAAQVVVLARKEGAQGAWASANRSRSTSVVVRNGVFEKVQENISRSLSVQLYVDGRYTAHSTNDLDAERLVGFVRDAVGLTRALEPDPVRELPDPQLFEGRSQAELELVDSSLASRTLEQRIEDCQAMNAEVRGEDAVLSGTSSTYDGEFRMAMASSNGFADGYAGTYAGLSTTVTLMGEGDKRPEDGYGCSARHRAELLAPAEVGRNALVRARAHLGSVKGPTRKGTIVVDRLAAGRLLGALLGPANGYSLQQGRSFWASRMGKQAVSPKLTIVDDPLRPRWSGSRPFDGEGIAAKAMPIIEAGVFRNVYVDTYYGRKLGMAPTTGGGSNRVISLGKRGRDELVGDVGEAVYVSSWLGGNSDPTTGDFSFGMRGHLIEGGKIGAPIGEMNVTGNLLELWSNLVEIGNDPWPFGSTRMPTLVFENVSLSGT